MQNVRQAHEVGEQFKKLPSTKKTKIKKASKRDDPVRPPCNAKSGCARRLCNKDRSRPRAEPPRVPRSVGAHWRVLASLPAHRRRLRHDARSRRLPHVGRYAANSQRRRWRWRRPRRRRLAAAAAAPAVRAPAGVPFPPPSHSPPPSLTHPDGGATCCGSSSRAAILCARPCTPPFPSKSLSCVIPWWLRCLPRSPLSFAVAPAAAAAAVAWPAGRLTDQAERRRRRKRRRCQRQQQQPPQQPQQQPQRQP